jgi:hypothetical protein
MLRIHGFNWDFYARRVMPAFAQWLIDESETEAQKLYEKTRSAREEAIYPAMMHRLQSWNRAQTFIHQLPRGPYLQREYRKLCSAEQFTDLSDRYVHLHPPQLPQHSDAIRIIWGAIVEEHCLLPLSLPGTDEEDLRPHQEKQSEEPDPTQGEIIALLDQAGLKELARKVQEVATDSEESEEETESPSDHFDQPPARFLIPEMSHYSGPIGIELGRHPSSLHLRGWLATLSVRAMALFELLACGRRYMPFGSRVGESFESYIGYLLPDEVWQLALCLRNVQAPSQASAEEQYRVFRQQKATHAEAFRMIDEVLPAQANIFIKTIRAAASQGMGLICSSE